MKVAVAITYFVFHVTGLNAFIVIPDEVPSILSVIYSNIPTLKKGTDSRIGWGFRIGDRADFQVMVELGPQTNTQPLANQGGDNTNKRNTINTLTNTLYAQRQQDKKKQEKKEKESSNPDDGSWLQTWSKTVSSIEEENKTMPKPGLAIGEIDAKSVIPDDFILDQVEKVKPSKPKKQVNKMSQKKANNANRSLISILTDGEQPTKPSSSPSIPEDQPLDDVSLE